MLRTIEERARLFRWTVEQVIEYDRQVEAEVATWPPLTPGQKARLRELFRPEPAAKADAQQAGERSAEDWGREIQQTHGQTSAPARAGEIRIAPRPREPRQPRRAAVYVIGTANGSRVKIGTTVNLDRRLAEISGMSPVPLELLWSTEGSGVLERALHAEFASRRLHGEWFDFSGTDPVAEVSAAAERLRPYSASAEASA